jgi:hypothetical protein
VVFALVSDDSTTVRLHPKDHTSLKGRTWLEQALALRLAIQNHHPREPVGSRRLFPQIASAGHSQQVWVSARRQVQASLNLKVQG